MDQFDRRILVLVQRDTRLTADIIGQKVGLSGPAVQKRLKKLKESGVIQKEIAVLDGNALDRKQIVIVEVSLERENLAVLNAFKQKMNKSPQVQQCYYITGEADFILILQLQDMQEYEEFTREYFFQESNVSKFKTSVVMDRVKVSLDVLSDE
ncbi:Lrp/AsnC family transcriptional regulator [Cohaesibacter gelatinilyticus]|mgnify:CR=1 FL=1|uniref:DNA-binding transcriptional regulator, Lrp family n=1 Tax=Cohaesibacter gelatinilyticus TaxID=372072 RepID=A0A285NGR4_9HYPH|nr:Lrp/AsnC family transcriptional regulator [Cohaesibacter gelatinilyticus]SNZ08645.1 DNA-binding transcriptional regulator, Lrp family [Cohaesibacter gelatinilyticus]HAT85125.1 Lrp/AsnC family transcriptional regulator [Hyphomicrobiales bacterium]